MDWPIHKLTKLCSATGRELLEGEAVYSVLVPADGDWKRLDYAAEAWQGPPEKCVAWWRSYVPTRDAGKPKLAPTDALLQFFDELADSGRRADMLYVLSLLLQRRRVLRLDQQETNPQGQEVSVLFCGRNERTYEVATVRLDFKQMSAVQHELERLLWGEATPPGTEAGPDQSAATLHDQNMQAVARTLPDEVEQASTKRKRRGPDKSAA